MWIPLSLTIVPTSLLPLAMVARARRRALRGHRHACGYELGGVAGACPECGSLVRRVLRWVRERAMTLGHALR